MRRISLTVQRGTSATATGLVRGQQHMRNYAVQPVTVYPLGLLPRPDTFMFNAEDGATMQINRVYILDKEARRLMRSEERLRTLKEAQAGASPAPATTTTTDAVAPFTGNADSSSATILATSAAPAPAPKAARARGAAKPIREARTSRKTVTPASSSTSLNEA